VSENLLQEYYYKFEMPKVKKAIAELKAENKDFAKECRLRYLNKKLSEAEGEIKEIYRTYESMTRENTIYIEKAIITTRLEGLEKEVKKIESEIRFIVNISKGKSNGITSEMIAQAREYPLENLIEVKRSMALCPFHDDRNPSMGIKNNHYHCFACGEKGDVISFVMKRDSLSFNEAVKWLNQN